MIASRIAGAIETMTAGQEVAILYGTDAGSPLAAFQAFKTEADTLKNLFDRIAPDGSEIAAVGEGLTAAVPLLFDLLSYLRQDRTYSGRGFQVADEVLAASIAIKLETATAVWVPQLFPAYRGRSEVSQSLAEVRKARNESVGRVEALTDPDRKKVEAARLAQMEKAFIDFESRLLTAKKDALHPMEVFHQGSCIWQVLDGGGLAVTAHVESAGGTVRTRRWAWVSRLDHSGGAIASYRVFGDNGRLQAAGTFADYQGPRKFGSAK